MSKITDKPRPMHEPVNDDEAKAMIDAIHYGTADSFFERVRSAGNGLLAKRAEAKPKPMHEPVTDEEARAMIAASERAEGFVTMQLNRAKASGNALLSRRAAATRFDVVVTEAMIRECEADWLAHGRIQMPMDYCRFAMNWLAARLNEAKP